MPSGPESAQECALQALQAQEFQPIDGAAEECDEGQLHAGTSALPAAPALVSMLPPDWGEHHQLRAVTAACHDLHGFASQLRGPYASFTDAGWVQAIQSCLLSGDGFQSGSLHRHLAVWRHYFDTTSFSHHSVVRRVLQWVQHGYTLDFVSPFAPEQVAHPRYERRLARLRQSVARVVGSGQVHLYLQGTQPLPIWFPNHQSCNDHMDFVQAELATFCAVGALELHDLGRHGAPVVHPMSVAVGASGKKRLCIDANYCNVFERYVPVQFELLRDVLPMLQQGDWAYVTDCTKGYFHVSLHPAAQRFLAVSIEGKTYVFKALPFGLSSAVKAYTDIMLAVYLPMRSLGMRFSFMIDDRLGLQSSRQACWLDIFVVVRILCALGFHSGLAKCVLWPMQQVRYLGLLLQLDIMRCAVPEDKLAKFVAAIDALIAAPTVTARELARVAGYLISFSLPVPLGVLYTRRLFMATAGQLPGWDDAFPAGASLQAHLL